MLNSGMRAPIAICTVLAGACPLWSCSASPSPDAKPGTEFCLDQAEVKRLEASAQRPGAARKLADYYGLCLSDGGRRLPFLKVLAMQGDVDAAEELRLVDEMYNHPPWISQKYVVLRTMGIDRIADAQVKGNYHWRWKAKRELSVGHYRCPVGSAVDASRNALVVIAPESTRCTADRGRSATMLKVSPDGFAEPLAERDDR